MVLDETITRNLDNYIYISSFINLSFLVLFNIKMEGNNINYSLFLRYRTYRDIFNLLYNRKYIYHNLVMKTLNDNTIKHIKKLLNYEIIEESYLNNKEIKELEVQNGMNEKNIKRMKIYRWTKKSLEYFNLKRVKDFIISKVRTKVIDKIKQFNDKVKKWRQEQNAKNEYNSRLMSINFNKVLKKSNFVGDLSYFNIHNAKDFMHLSLREIAKITRLTRTTIEKIEKNILEELGGFT